jgi:hypothetical protein
VLRSLKDVGVRVPVIGPLARRGYHGLRVRIVGRPRFDDSRTYWERRYATGGDSGAGSYGKLSEYKADFINSFVADHDVRSVIEFGCGDGHQLELGRYPEYAGYDVSPSAITRCQAIFAGDPSKSFGLMSAYDGSRADLTLSLDVIYHLVEDEVFDEYMRTLFGAALRHVIIYSSNTTDNAGHEGTHIRQRRFTDWVASDALGWKLIAHVPNKYPFKGDVREGSFADFFVYGRQEQ